MRQKQLEAEADGRTSFKLAVVSWRQRRWTVRLFVCPQRVRRKGESHVHPCGVINCPEFLADLGDRAVSASERKEFIRLNGFDPMTLLDGVAAHGREADDARGSQSEVQAHHPQAGGRG